MSQYNPRSFETGGMLREEGILPATREPSLHEAIAMLNSTMQGIAHASGEIIGLLVHIRDKL